MATHNLIKLVPKTPFHIGDNMDLERTEELIHSDTLFSAMCRISDVYLGKENYRDFIKPFIEGTPPFLLSSIFPYIETDEETIYFFPKPYIFKDFVEQFPKNIKSFKKIRYISKKLFDAYLREDDEFLERQFQKENGEVIKNHLLQGENIWVAESERKLISEIDNIWKQSQEPRVAIDRESKQTSIFHYARIHFHKQAGLYVLIKTLEGGAPNDILKEILIRLRYLGDTGLGGERSSGCGQFEPKLTPEQRPHQIDLGNNREISAKFLSLSLFLPKKEEVEQGLIQDASYYEILNRRGWISNFPYRRQSIKMMSEGSMFHNIKHAENRDAIYGKLVEITPQILRNEDPEYKIHRYGYGYPIYLEK